jgi:hypothetical protein
MFLLLNLVTNGTEHGWFYFFVAVTSLQKFFNTAGEITLVLLSTSLQNTDQYKSKTSSTFSNNLLPSSRSISCGSKVIENWTGFSYPVDALSGTRKPKINWAV